MDARSGRGRVLLPPLLRLPAGSEHRQPRRARRDHADHGVLAAARRVRLPHGRGAVPDRAARAPTSTPAQGLRAPARDARLPAVAPPRRDPAGRGERAAGREPGVLRRSRRPAADDAELPGQPARCSTRWRPATSKPLDQGARSDQRAAARRRSGCTSCAATTSSISAG